MAELNPDHGLIAGRGAILINEPGAEPPTLQELVNFAADYSVLPANGWAPFGDMDPEDLPAFDADGGDFKTLSTWAFANVRQVQEDAKTSFFEANGIQFDNDTMRIYEGGGDETGTEIFWAPGNPIPTRAGVTVVAIDASIGRTVGYHAPLMSVTGNGGVEFQRDEWTQIPLKFTELLLPGKKGPHAWIGEGFGKPATVVGG